MQAEQVAERIREQLSGAEVKVVSPDGTHFSARVVAEAFVGKRQVQRHQMVYGTIQEWISSGELHALQLETLTPEEFNKIG